MRFSIDGIGSAAGKHTKKPFRGLYGQAETLFLLFIFLGPKTNKVKA